MSILYDDGGGAPGGDIGGLGGVGEWSAGPGSARLAAANRGAETYNRLGVRYPSPFFDLATTYMPKSAKELFKWCAYYFKVHPLINAVAYKMAEYPVTPLVIEDDDTKVVKKWTEIADNVLQIRKTRIELNLDYNVFGNGYLSIAYPFDKYIICKKCGKRAGGYAQKMVDARPYYRWRGNKIYLDCPKCGHHGVARLYDYYVKDLKGIRLVRWSPLQMTVDYNQSTGRSTYYYHLPKTLRNDIMMGKRSVIEQVPSYFIEAARKGRGVVFSEGSIFHLKRGTISEDSQGLGMPMIMPVLKDVFYLQVLRKGQEAIAQEHIVPLRMLFPQGGDSVSSPYATTNLGAWRDRIESELARWRMDSNYIPILPLPIGHQLIGGQGRAMVLHQELRVWAEHIIAGMGVPQEFIFGGLQWSGSNVSLRMLENSFRGNLSDHRIMVRDFIIKGIARFMGWQPPRNVDFEKFRMADDLQRQMLYFQLNQAQKISDTTMLSEIGEELEVEEKLKQQELTKQLEAQKHQQMAAAEVQGQMQVIQAKYQGVAMGQGVPTMPPLPPAAGGNGQSGPPMMPPGPPGPQSSQPTAAAGIPPEAQSPVNSQDVGQGGTNLLALARKLAGYLRSLPPGGMGPELNKLKVSNPGLHDVVVQLIQSRQGGQEDPLNAMQRPTPGAKPPRSPTPGV